MQHGKVYAQCSDSEALLKVSYNDPSWQGEYGKVRILVTGSSPAAGSTTIEEVEREHPSDTPFSFELCIPKDDTCGTLSVTGPPRYLLEISWDNQVLTEADTGPEIIRYKNDSMYYDTPTYVTAAQFGDGCIPDCENGDEALFQFQYKKRWVDRRWWMSKGYRLEDQNGNKIIAYDNQRLSDKQPLAKAGVYAKRMCLPKKDCYRLIMGNFWAEDGEHVSISFDDNALFESKAWYYESINFGEGCPSIRSCDPNEESTVKFFMATSVDIRRSSLYWELDTHDGGTIRRGKQADDLNTTLHYDEICVPKGSCMTFSLGSPEDGESTRYNSARYMLSMDGVIYRRSLYYPTEGLPEDENLDTTYLGDCASTTMGNSICQHENETLFELNFQTSSKGDHSSPFMSKNNFWSISRIEESEIISNEMYANDFFLPDYEFNSYYRAIQCIPNEHCLYLTVINNDYETYSVKLDGELLEAETTIAEFGDYEYEVTDLGVCDSLSGGAIVGIVVASVFVAGTLVALSIWTIRRSRKGV